MSCPPRAETNPLLVSIPAVDVPSWIAVLPPIMPIDPPNEIASESQKAALDVSPRGSATDVPDGVLEKVFSSVTVLAGGPEIWYSSP
jgi:hypothetical protein